MLQVLRDPPRSHPFYPDAGEFLKIRVLPFPLVITLHAFRVTLVKGPEFPPDNGFDCAIDLPADFRTQNLSCVELGHLLSLLSIFAYRNRPAAVPQC